MPYNSVYNISHYKTIRTYLLLLGLELYQKKRNSYIIVTMVQITLSSILVPTIFELYISLQKKNISVVIECMAHLCGVIIAMVKISSIHYNRENYKKLLDLIAKKWEELELVNELDVLEKITAQGSKFAYLYRSLMVIFAIFFLTIPLVFPVLDIVLPLNETRVRLQIFKINYLIVNNDEYFYVEYLHLTLATCIMTLTVLGIDSLYIIIIYHNSSLFALTGYQIKKAMDSSSIEHNSFADKNVYDQVKRSAITYNEAIHFFDIIRECSERQYLIQISLMIVGLSVTAFQTAINLSHPEKVIRSALFFVSDQIVLLITSIIGQVVLNHSSELENQIYNTEWYRVSKKIQRMVHIMQIRSRKPCILTAGGIYKMNLENFRSTFKACMSYCSMLLSVEQ